MGLLSQIFGFLFGEGRNVVKETAEVFRENAEAGAVRGQVVQAQAMAQFGGEFAPRGRSGFDRFMDGINRIPRPAMAMGAIGLVGAAMTDPVWFAARMQGVALVPEPLWWLMGIVVSFYFGARHQVKGQEFQRSIAETMAMTPTVVKNIEAIEALKDAPDAIPDDPNPALMAWHAEKSG